MRALRRRLAARRSSRAETRSSRGRTRLLPSGAPSRASTRCSRRSTSPPGAARALRGEAGPGWEPRRPRKTTHHPGQASGERCSPSRLGRTGGLSGAHGLQCAGGVRVRVVRTQLGCSRGGERVQGTRKATGSPSRRREQSGRPLEPRGGRGPGVWFGRRERAPELSVCEYVCVHRGEVCERHAPLDLNLEANNAIESI